jgi:hypothetical protein
MGATTASTKLSDLYGQMTSLERVFASLRRNDVDLEQLTARDHFQQRSAQLTRTSQLGPPRWHRSEAPRGRWRL